MTPSAPSSGAPSSTWSAIPSDPLHHLFPVYRQLTLMHETFDFLGFQHFCTRSRKWGSFVIGRRTIKKTMLRQLQAVKMELRKRMHDPIAKTERG